jgi:hypothetical protein
MVRSKKTKKLSFLERLRIKNLDKEKLKKNVRDYIISEIPGIGQVYSAHQILKNSTKTDDELSKKTKTARKRKNK